MALESGYFISDLNPANPAGTDNRSQGDDHIRLIKSTLKNTFPYVNGAVTATDEQLNAVAAAGALAFPGMIVMWSGSVAYIPSGWKLCDGVGTISTGAPVPDLVGRFIVGTASNAGGYYNVGQKGGSKDAVVVNHSHFATSTVSDPGHSHMGATNAGGGASFGFDGYDYNNIPSVATTGISVSTTIVPTGVSGVDANLPPYYALAFLIKN